MHDLILRAGTVVDGTGAPPRTADVAIDGDMITEVGSLKGERAGREVDADGLLVTPGFVDMHTHYDGQATWDPLLSPSCWHGVTTVVMGNCGVGFAPVHPGTEEWLIQLMEGVEDIPGTALAEGITWGWETFPEYLDALERLPRALDIGTQVPHGAVRAYVMGERGARNEPATPADIEAMAEIVLQGLQAGALGFSTSRTIVHRAVDGEPVPGTFAAEDELMGIGRALASAGRGVFEVAPAGVMGEDLLAPAKEVAWMRRLSAETGRPVTFALAQHNRAPEQWRDLLELAEAATRGRGGAARPGHGPPHQSAGRLADPDPPLPAPADLPGHCPPSARGADRAAARSRGTGRHPGRAQPRQPLGRRGLGRAGSHLPDGRAARLRAPSRAFGGSHRRRRGPPG